MRDLLHRGLERIIVSGGYNSSNTGHLVEIARESAVRVMLNPAPAYPLPDRLLGMVDMLVVNEIEARALADHAVEEEVAHVHRHA